MFQLFDPQDDSDSSSSSSSSSSSDEKLPKYSVLMSLLKIKTKQRKYTLTELDVDVKHESDEDISQANKLTILQYYHWKVLDYLDLQWKVPKFLRPIINFQIRDNRLEIFQEFESPSPFVPLRDLMEEKEDNEQRFPETEIWEVIVKLLQFVSQGLDQGDIQSKDTLLFAPEFVCAKRKENSNRDHFEIRLEGGFLFTSFDKKK
mmetsp:Transcript_41962/g.64245  ORF Transcript_41962/g.64245 Transcript_41962/m.64245 type:complete len:204 (+) Transcript_41962:131-742(+)